MTAPRGSVTDVDFEGPVEGVADACERVLRTLPPVLQLVKALQGLPEWTPPNG